MHLLRMNSDLSYVSIYPFFGQLGPDYHHLDLRPLTLKEISISQKHWAGGVGDWKRKDPGIEV